MKTFVVLPAYNEASNLPAIFEGFVALIAREPGIEVRVIVVDDGSTDSTAEVASAPPAGLEVELVRHERNQGLAAAFRNGMLRAAEQAEPADVIVVMDADNSHQPSQIPALVRRLDEGLDVVVASRYQPGAVVRGVPVHRLALSSGMRWLFRAAYPIKGVRDYSCGFRAYRAGIIQEAFARQGERLFTTEGFACMVATLIRLNKQGAAFGEVPIVLRYDQKEGESKMRVGSTVLRTLAILVRERLSAD